MYEAYYRFNRPPFSLTPDPEFLFKSQSHQAALEQLLRGIRRREGFLLLTADIGTGKTTIWRTVIEQLGPKTFTAVVRNSFSSEEELLLSMLQDFGVVSPADVHQGRLSGASKQQLVDTLNDFLRSLTPLGASAVLVIDEAQKLTPPLLEQLRVLTNRDTDQDKLLQVLLVGQLEMQSLLSAPRMRALHQRVSRRCTLEPLKRRDVGTYVAHRLRIAGSPWHVGFTNRATDLVYEFSGGVPRRINLLCDRALEAGCDAFTPCITPELVLEAAETLELKAAPMRSPRRRWRVSAAAAAGMSTAAGAVVGLGIGAALYLQSPFVDSALAPLPRRPVALASVALPEPVKLGAAFAGSESTSAEPSAASYSIVVASFPDASASAAAAAMLRALAYRVLERAPSGTGQEFLVLVGPYTDLDWARQDEAQLRSLWQFREARIVALQ